MIERLEAKGQLEVEDNLIRFLPRLMTYITAEFIS